MCEIHAFLLQNWFCCNLHTFVADFFVAIYAFLCGEKINQQLRSWRKNDKYQVWVPYILYIYNITMLQSKICCNTATNTKIIQIFKVCRVDPIYPDIFGPAERLRYMACRLTSDISTKDFHLQYIYLYIHTRSLEFQCLSCCFAAERVPSSSQCCVN